MTNDIVEIIYIWDFLGFDLMSEIYFIKLGESDFEDLSRNILMEIIGPGIDFFSPGKDSGRDAIFKGKAPYPSKNDCWDGQWIFQVKFNYMKDGPNKARKNVIKRLKVELDKITKNKLKCDYYFLITNVPMMMSDLDKIKFDIKPNYPDISEIVIWDYNKMKLLLQKFPYIKRNYPDLIETSDLLSFIHFDNCRKDLDNLMLFEKSKEPIIQKHQIETISNSILNLSNYLITESNLSKWKDCFFVICKIINNTLISKLDKEETTILNSFNKTMNRFYHQILTSCFELKKWDRISYVFDNVSLYFNSIKDFDKETLYVIWITNLRNLYKSTLLPRFKELETPIYDEEEYFSVISYCFLLIRALDNSLDCKDGIYSYDLGLSFVRDIIIERLKIPREFHTAEDDNTFTLPFSVLVKPLVDGLISTWQKLIEYKLSIDNNSTIYFELETTRKRYISLIFIVLTNYRDRDLLHELRFDRLGYLLQNHYFLKNEDFLHNLREFIHSKKPVGFRFIIEHVTNCLVKEDVRFDNSFFNELFILSLDGYKEQRKIYPRDSTILRMLCIICLEKVDKKYQLKMIFNLAKTLTNYSKMNCDYDYIYGFQLFGLILLDGNTDSKIISFLESKIKEMINIQINNDHQKKSKSLLKIIYERNLEIANYSTNSKIENDSEILKPVDIKRFNVIGSLLFDRIYNEYEYRIWINASKIISDYLINYI